MYEEYRTIHMEGDYEVCSGFYVLYILWLTHSHFIGISAFNKPKKSLVMASVV